MQDRDTSDEQLLHEVDSLRQRVAELERANAAYKRLEQTAKESERRYHRMVNTLNDALFVATAEGTIMDVNPAACVMYGYQRDELIGIHATALVHPDFHDVFRGFQQSFRETDQFHGHTVDVRKDGSTFHTDVLGSKVDFDGVPHLLAIVRDVSEQRSLERSLRGERSWSHQLLDTALDGYLLADAHGQIRDANPSYCQTVGYTRDELLSMNIRQLEAALAQDQVEERINQLLAAGNARFETRHRRKDGESVVLEASVTVLRSEGLPLIAASVRDITNRKRAENELQKYIRYLENMERIDRVIRQATELEQVLQGLLCEVLSILDCDRAWLVFPCDPEAEWMTVRFECTRPEYPGAFAAGQTVPVTPASANTLREALDCEGPLVLDPDSGRPLPDAVEPFAVRSQMMMALHPKPGTPWMLGVHQCLHARVWTDEEQRFLNDVGHRITDSLTSLLSRQELRKSEAKYRLLVENQTDMVVKLDTEGRLTFVSPSCSRIFGKTRKELLNSDFMPLIHQDDRERVARALHLVHQPPYSAYVQERVMTVDGWRWQAWMNTAVVDENGEVTEIVSVGRDITEQKKAEAALKESEMRYRTLFESAGDGIFLEEVDDHNLRLVDCNSRALSMFGGTRDEVLGKRPLDFSPPTQPDGRSSVDRATGIIRAVLEGVDQSFEWQHRRVDGTTFDAEVTLSRVVRDSQPYVMGVVRDVTERKRAEKALAESEQRFRIIFEQAAVGVALVETATGRFVRVNQKYCDLVGYAVEEMTERTFQEITHPDDLQEDLDNMKQLVAGEIPEFTMEKRYYQKDDSVVWVNLTVSPTWEPGEEPHYHIAIVEDITDRKKTERALHQSHDRMEEQVQERSAELEQASEGLKAEIVRRKRAQKETAVFRRFAEASGEGLGMADLDGTITYANATLCRFLGEGTPADAEGKNIRDYYRKEDLSTLENTIFPAVLNDEHRAVEIPLLSIDGVLTPVIQSIFLIRDDQGRPFRLANVLTDIAERKQIEEQLKRHRDHLEEMVGDRTADLERANEGLRKEIADRKRAEERFRLAAGVSSDLIYEWNVHDDSLEWFGPLDKALGYQVGEIPQTIDGWIQLMHVEDLARLKDAVERHRTLTIPIYEEYRLRHRDGTWRRWIDRAVPVLDKQDRPVKWVGACVDITERKRAEAELLLKNIVFDSSIAANSTADSHGIIQHVNSAFLGMWGYEEEDEVVGNPISCFFANEQEGIQVQEELNTTGRWHGTFVAKRKDGSTFSSEGLATIVRNEKGDITGYQSANLDITDRERAEKALRESEERFRHLFDEARDGILLANAKTKQLGLANRAICEMLGYSNQEFEQLEVHDIHPEEDLPYVIDCFERQGRGEISVAPDVPMKRKDGSVFYVDVNSASVLLRGERYLIGQFRDVTERKQAEKRIRKLNVELEGRVEERTAELKSANQELNSYAYSVSHDLRAPLRAMEGFANALVEDYGNCLDEAGFEYCQHIVESAARMDVLIKDLLDYSRLGRAELRLQAVNLERVVREAIRQIESEIEERQANVVIQGTFHDVSAHYRTLVQVAVNLISNAVKFVASGVRPEVRIWAEPRGDAVRLWVEDNGIGIDAEYQEKIFSVFNRLHGIESYPGTGIGLAIVSRSVNRLGGRCGVESFPGKGSRFWVEFCGVEEGDD